MRVVEMDVAMGDHALSAAAGGVQPCGRQPARRDAIAERAGHHEDEIEQPRTRKVCQTPTEVGVEKVHQLVASGEPIMAPPPKPMIAMPVAMPRRSGNHLISVETGEI